LINESNFADYLQGFTSDADNYNVPPVWYKTIPFTPPDGEFTKVIFNVDPSNFIPERSELNNTFVLEIDKLPTPAQLSIDNFTQRRVDNSLTSYMVDFSIKNSGEENGLATVKIYQGKYPSNSNPIYTSAPIIPGLNQFNINTFIDIDVTAGSYCGQTNNYTLVVTDDQGHQSIKEFQLPLYSGSISGRVEDLLGKKVEGATVSTNTGQTATVDKYGWYHLKGISVLGQITLTATHPEYSQTETKDIQLSIKDEMYPCDEGSLTWYGIDFILKDQDVLFTVTVNDSFGNPVNAHVLATNQDWRFEADINGQGPLPDMQPGEYVFTISAPGYKTTSQNVSAVPSDSTLEFVLDKLDGRLTDGGLTIHQPQLLWEKDLGTQILANMTATKDGKVVMYYTTQNRLNSGKLYFIDLHTGEQRAVISTPSTGGQSQSSLDTSYDGNTTALMVHAGTFGISKNAQNILTLLDNHGNIFGNLNLDSKKSAGLCEVSPDGFYVYPYQLLNKGLYQYTNREILGNQHNNSSMTYTASTGFHFTSANNKVAGCSKGGGYCVETINKTVVTNLGNIDGTSTQTDSSQDGHKIGLLTIKKAYLFGDGAKVWEKDVDIHGDPLSLSVSPGGKMVIFSSVNQGEPYRSIKIFSDTNVNKTPPGSQTGTSEDVVFVHANDQGIYYAALNHKKLKFYQVGSYSTDYNPATPPPTSTPPLYVNGLSYWDNGVFQNLGGIVYYQLQPFTIYMANQTVSFDMMEPYGTLRILEGTLFGVDTHHHPVILKGQITADFNSPTHVYAIKFDRYDLNLFSQKLSQFSSGNLPQSEYFEITNVHTKFIVTNQINQIGVKVASGQVKVLGQDINQDVNTGKQIILDQDNHFKTSIYLTNKIYLWLISSFAALLVVILVYYRKTKLGKQIIHVLRVIGNILIQVLKKLIAIIRKIIKIIAPLIWQLFKKGIHYLREFFQKQFKK